jgi:hypothetical protein
MEIKEMSAEQLEARKAEIRTLVENAKGEELNALENEVRSINEELETRKAEEAKKVEIRKAVAEGAGVVVKTVESEERKGMKIAEIRASKAYVDAYAEGIKTKDMSACRSMLLEAEDINAEQRALLTTNGGGTVSVPTIVEDIVKNAWEKDEIARRVKKTYLKGNLKVDFELSSDGATVQTEGQAVNEESLVLGTTDLTPELILKWVSISVQSADLRGEAFLQYVYDELVHKIAEKAVDRLIEKIEACGTQATTNAVGVPKVTSATVSIGTIATAMAELSAQATNPVIMMNRKSWGEFKKVQANNKYAYDPFEGLDVVYNNSIKAFNVATTGETYVIVGDLGEGAQFNFPNGEEIDVVEDRLTLATAGKVKEIGSQYVGIGVIGPNSFVKITK